MLTYLAAGLALAVAAGGDAPSVQLGKAAAAARAARAEGDLCVAACPPMPAAPTSDWLRSPEGRKVNACPMSCRMDLAASALFRSLADLATSPKPDPEAPVIKAAGKDGPELLKRLRLALREAEGQRLGPLCARARASVRPPDEVVFVECTGRAAPATAGEGLTPPDAGRAPRCAAAFAERELAWLKRCGSAEARTDLDACVEQAVAARRVSAAAAREKCENDAVERLAAHGHS
ncbi:hypothetical protein [Anaeromyxobacter diazotrophicus]|uniref:Uncharacterized protein n=1 Tax=Anaeromyxobacter diazotrophicus TaxID=2590199 RepID=A0A7I9VJE0_9BACT|nr:hypothetical protein [Anaeromyxobacter diazotrophicus]GEJ56521.1 hypothetical protein AMYX_12620 [Anaeromyxobacter diazotrophicus]